MIDCCNNQIYTKEEIDNVRGEIVGVLTVNGDAECRKLVKQIKDHQKTDKVWGKIRQDVEKGCIQSGGKRNYCIWEDILFLEKKRARNKWVVCIPEEDILQLLKAFHEKSLHPGISRMQQMMGNLVVWSGMMKYIRIYVRSCHDCQITKSKSRSFSGVWQPIIPTRSGELMAVDVLGPLVKSLYGILVILDVFSKFIQLYGIKNTTSRTC